ncbi:MAG: hypothetical protein P8Y78_10125, partial [Acidihalobacter sp.]
MAATECPGEMRRILETDLPGDLHHGKSGSRQQHRCALHAKGIELGMNGMTGLPAVQAREMAPGHAAEPCDHIQTRTFVEPGAKLGIHPLVVYYLAAVFAFQHAPVGEVSLCIGCA